MEGKEKKERKILEFLFLNKNIQFFKGGQEIFFKNLIFEKTIFYLNNTHRPFLKYFFILLLQEFHIKSKLLSISILVCFYERDKIREKKKKNLVFH